MRRMKWEDEVHRKNREAEESHVRKKVWGEQPGAGDDGDEDVGDVTYLGDIQETHHHVTADQPIASSRSLAKTIGAIGLAAAGLGIGVTAPIVAYNLTRPKNPEVATATAPDDTNTQYGLRIFRTDRSR